MKRKTFLTIISALSLTLMAGGVGVTIAKFTVATKLEQEIVSKGKAKTSLFLDPFIWDKNDPIYVLYAIDTSEGGVNKFIYPSKIVNVTISGITYPLRVFEFDDTVYEKFKFVRASDSFDEDAGNWNTWRWNETYDIVFSDYKDYNYFKINEWKTNDTYPTNSGCYIAKYKMDNNGDPTIDSSDAIQYRG